MIQPLTILTSIFAIFASFIVLFERKNFKAKESLLRYKSHHKRIFKPEIVLVGVVGCLSEVLAELSSLGFSVYTILIVDNNGNVDSNIDDSSLASDYGEFIITVGVSPKLLLNSRAVSFEDPIIKDVPIMDNNHRIRIAQRALYLIQESKLLTYQHAELLHDNSSDEDIEKLRSLLKNGLENYYGTKFETMFSYLNIVSVSLFLGLPLWVLSISLSLPWLSQCLGIIMSLVFSIVTAVWKSDTLNMDDPYYGFREFDNLGQVELSNLVGHVKNRKRTRIYLAVMTLLIIGSMVGMQYYGILEYSKLKSYLRSFIPSILKRYMNVDMGLDGLYYVIGMYLTLIVDGIFTPILVHCEGHLLPSDRSASSAWKTFIIRISLFVCKLFHIVYTSNANVPMIQYELSLLFICHCFLYDIIDNKASKIVTKISNEERYDRNLHPDRIRRVEVIRDAIVTNSQNVGMKFRFEPHLESDDLVLLQECRQPKPMINLFIIDLLVVITTALLFASFIPMAIPLAILCIWRKRNHHWWFFLQRFRRPLVDDEIHRIPWLDFIDFIAFLVVAINIAMLFLYLRDPSVPLLAVSPIKATPMNSSRKSDDVSDSSSLRDICGIKSWENVYIVLLLAGLEHVWMWFQFFVLPALLNLYHGRARDSVKAYDLLEEFKENSFFRLTVLRSFCARFVDVKVYSSAKVAVSTTNIDAKLRLADFQSVTGISMPPSIFFILTILPYALQYNPFMPISWMFSLPVILITTVCYHYKADIMSCRSSASLIANDQVKSVILQNLPQYVYDADSQRCEWVNKADKYLLSGLSLTWKGLRAYGEKKIASKIVPKLNSSKPKFIKEMFMSRISVGNVPPCILGIRVLSGNPSATDDVEVDVDFKWLSEMDMELTVVLSNGMELSFGMSNFRISGTLRMHFYDLIVKIPPFANCKVTFFKKPDIDFSINVMKTDIMDFGITHASIGDAVQFAMKQALQSMAIYPEWQLIELEEPSDDLVYMKSGKIKTQMIEPQGVLTITIERANNLIIGDYNSSDPYVVMTLNNHEQRTETKDKTLNPIWNDATFNFLVYDKENETLLFEVWDEDSFKRGDFLGSTSLELKDLEECVSTSYTSPLEKVPNGTLTFKVVFVSLASEMNVVCDERDFDELFQSTSNSLASILLESLHNQAPNSLARTTSDDDYVTKYYDRKDTQPEFLRRKVSSIHIPTSVRKNEVVEIAGVLTVSKISISNISSVKTLLSNAHRLSCKVVFETQYATQSTPLADKKDLIETNFKENFHFIVKDHEDDSLKVKILKPATIGSTILSTHQFLISEVVNAPFHILDIEKDLNKDFPTLSGILKFQLQFRPAVLHM